MTTLMFLLFTFLASSGSGEISFEKVAPKSRPTVKAVEKALSVRAVQCIVFTTHGGTESYITRWHRRVAVDVEWEPDGMGGIPRVTRLKFRPCLDRGSFSPLRPAHDE